MKPLLLPAFILLAASADAQVLPAFHGQWQGEGSLQLGDEPEQRFQCRLGIDPLGADEAHLVGRCATAQGAQSLNYTLSEATDGSLRATERSAVRDAELTELTGSAEPGRLSFTGEDGAALILERQGRTLHFTLSGHDERGPATGSAVLHLRD